MIMFPLVGNAHEGGYTKESITVIVLLGVSGSGKSAIGQRLAEHLRWPFFDGDDFHPDSNIAKMRRHQPLTDADRELWLDRLADRIEASIGTGDSAVVACSALKQSYRKRLAGGRREVVFVYLKGSPDLIAGRLARRQGHFMPADLLPSQFAALEEPADALIIDIDQPPEAIVAEILVGLGDRIAPQPSRSA